MHSEAKQLIDKSTKALVDALKKGHSDNLKNFLTTSAKFYKYSLNNWLMIYSQDPKATRVAGYKAWQKLGRQVKKGGTSIKILAPRKFKRKKGDGEETEEGMYFKAVAVFDVSQTEGKDLPTVFATSGDPGEYLEALETFIAEQGIELVEEESLRGAHGRSYGGKIEVLASITGAQRAGTLIHELAHELLHDKEARKDMTKAQKETEAEAVSFIVGQAIGIDSLGQTADYVQLWGGDLELFHDCLARIQKCSKTIIEGIT